MSRSFIDFGINAENQQISSNSKNNHGDCRKYAVFWKKRNIEEVYVSTSDINTAGGDTKCTSGLFSLPFKHRPRRSPRLFVKALNDVLIKRRKQAEELLREKPLKVDLHKAGDNSLHFDLEIGPLQSSAVLGKSTQNSLEVTNRC